jgi:hypothetical protein
MESPAEVMLLDGYRAPASRPKCISGNLSCRSKRLGLTAGAFLFSERMTSTPVSRAPTAFNSPKLKK